MVVRIHQWQCSRLVQEERERSHYGQSYRPYGDHHTGHDGLAFAWDGVDDPFQPETGVYGRIVREGWTPEKSSQQGYCRCGAYLQPEVRDATPEESSSYHAAKRVRVPASMLSGGQGHATMTGTMVTQAPAVPVDYGFYKKDLEGIAEMVKLLREHITATKDEIKELRSTMLKKSEQPANIVRMGKEGFAEVLKHPSALPEGTLVLVEDAIGVTMHLKTQGEFLLFKNKEERAMLVKDENGVEIETKKPLLTRVKESTVVKAVTEETKDASWRGAALMTIDLAKSCLEKAKPFLPKQYQKFHKPLMEFVATPLGGSALAYGAGVLLSAPFMPGAGTGKQKRIAYELRVNATTVAGYTLIKPLVGFMTNVALGGFAGILATLPDVDGSTGVRVEAASEDKTDAEAIAEHNETVAAKKAALK